MQWFAENMVETYLIIGVALLIIEIAVLGFSTFFLFFAGLGAIVTSLLIWLGVVPDDFFVSLACFAGATAVLALALWKPLAKMQSNVDTTRPQSDIIGHSFILADAVQAAIPKQQQPTYHYSGIDWHLQSEQDLAKGTKVEVVQTDVGTLWIKAAE